MLPTSSGYGGFVELPREGQQAEVEFQGAGAKGWTVPLLVDGWSAGKDVQADWDAILALADMRGSQAPPQVQFVGQVPRGVSRRAWFIQSPTIGEERLDDVSNRMLRGRLTLNLIDPTSNGDIASPIRQAIAKGGAQKASRTIRARKGDTLVMIAARELHDPERWREISQLNGRIQPDNVKPGQKVRLPA